MDIEPALEPALQRLLVVQGVLSHVLDASQLHCAGNPQWSEGCERSEGGDVVVALGRITAFHSF